VLALGGNDLEEGEMEAVLATILFTFDVVGLFVLWKYRGIET
jgi:hypothetical protein